MTAALRQLVVDGGNDLLDLQGFQALTALCHLTSLCPKLAAERIPLEDEVSFAPGPPVLLPGRAKEGDHRGLNRRGHVHGGGIHTDEETGAGDEGGRLLEGQPSAQVDDGGSVDTRAEELG